jgi:hypothetical protein
MLALRKALDGGHTRLRVRGWGSPDTDDWRKSLALFLQKSSRLLFHIMYFVPLHPPAFCLLYVCAIGHPRYTSL